MLGNTGVEKSGHDLKFVSLTLAERGVHMEGLGLDTMLASYLLNATAAATRSSGRARIPRPQDPV